MWINMTYLFFTILNKTQSDILNYKITWNFIQSYLRIHNLSVSQIHFQGLF